MRNIFRTTVFLGLLSVLFSLIITCIKVEKKLMVSTGQVNNILANTAKVSGTIVDIGEGATQHGHYYSTSKDVSLGGSSLKTELGKPNSTGDYTSQLTNLIAATTYYIKAYVRDGNGYVFGKEISFTTAAAILPTLTTIDVTAVTMTSGSSGGNVTSDGGSTVTARGVCWSTSANPTVVLTTKTTDAGTTGAFTSSLTGLTAGTTYYIRAYATNSVGTAYGNEISFTTIATTVPVLTTIEASLITFTTATSGGNVTSDGGSTVTARGVCWSTLANPTNALTTKTADAGTTGAFTSSLAGLTAGTTYYIRAYATNSVGTAYGNEISFTTIATTVPVLTTIEASLITDITATSGGNVTSDGGSTVTVRGVCWSTSANPTVALTTKTTDVGTTGSFTSSLTGLTAGTTYYIRAYATNSVGTAYGAQGSFTTLLAGQFSDIDGNVYNTVTIGAQVWMKENLKTKKYNDGTSIPNETNETTWGALTTGAYCDYNNTPTNSNTYGRLYNWFAVDNNAATKVASNGGKNVCPTSWHVPSDAEWTTLINFLGGESVAGGKLKEIGITYWTSPNTGATNESGFTALPGGERQYNGPYSFIGSYGFWWSSKGEANAWSYLIRNDLTNVTKRLDLNQYGFSVRCIKDN